jgi:hypothetical protein
MQNFTGARVVSVENCGVIKRGLLGVIGLVAMMFVGQTVRAGDFDPVFGFYRPELFATVDGSTLLSDLTINDYLGGRLPGSTKLGRMGSAAGGNLSAGLVSSEPQPRTKSKSVSGPVKDPKDGKDYSSAESMAAEKASLSWTGGEIGVMYGHATGKFGGDIFSSYITGGVGNDHLQINVGAAYQETNFSRSRH